jgi:CheY-like chemotaxis protein
MKTKWNHALIVSDNFVHRSMLEFNLAKTGFVVTLATDAKEAFKLAEKHSYDLIVTDNLTPQGTGVDLARQLRYLEKYDETPMVLLAEETADLDMEYLRRELWLLVVREPCNLVEVVNNLAPLFMSEQVS